MAGLIQVVGASPRKAIRLQTADDTDIPNEQYLEVPDAEIRALPTIRGKYGPDLDERAPPTGMYNCHGLAFGGRRTSIYDPSILSVILSEDRYAVVLLDNVLPGDLIVYFGENEGIVHSGIVVTPPQPPLRIPRVCSKWGANAEFLHWANRTPYGFNWKFYRVVR